MALSDNQKGRIIEQLIGAALMLQSDGNLRVSIPLVDDEGVDLVVGNRLNDKTLILQIKSRFNLNTGRFHAHVRRNTCRADPNRFLLFVFFEREFARLGETCWLVRADTFCQLLRKHVERLVKNHRRAPASSYILKGRDYD
jgi:hypothetical protein